MPKFINFEELKLSHPIDELMAMLDLDWDPNPAKTQFRASCPVHGGRRSLTVTIDKAYQKDGIPGVFFCQTLGRGGDGIGLIAHVLEIGQNEAAHYIRDQLDGGNTVPRGNTVPAGNTVPKAKEVKETQKFQPSSDKLAEIAAKLITDHEAIEALGLSEETCKHFGAGIRTKGVLIRSPGPRLAIPQHSLAGELLFYMGFATSQEQTPLITFPKGVDPADYIFNWHRVEQGELYYAQNPLDVLLAYENGVENVVSTLSVDNVVAFPQANIA